MAFTTQALYTEQVLKLTRSVVIKLDSIAYVMNEYLKRIGSPVDDDRPETWKYYLHLSGQYHSTDTLMRVTSLDTLEEIDFTYDNLKYHRATFNAYREKGTYYRALINKYEEQIDLINGILNPVDIWEAIKAKNFTIIQYDKSLVNGNETNLIPELQKWVIGYSDSWYNHNYVYLFDEYVAVFLRGLYDHMSGEIINIRRRNTRTEYVHDYHLWAYLASHQRLDKYRDYLTREQALWLYRNIAYLEAHPGWDHTFGELIEWLLTKRNIPLTSFMLAHNLESLPDSISPTPEIVKVPLNRPAYTAGDVRKEPIPSTLSKEIPLAEGNSGYYDEQIVNVPEKFKLSRYNQLQTKVLESDMVDRSDAQPVHYITTVLNEWIYLSATDKYQANVTLTNPYTSEVISMTAKESVIVWLYCLHRMLEVEIQTVPTFLAHDVMRPISPRFGELRDMSPYKYISEEMILAVMDEFVPQGQIISVEKFQEVTTAIHNAVTQYRYLYSTQENHHTRGHLENLTRRMFMEYRCKLVEDTTYYDDFFHLKGWKMDSMTVEQYQDMGNQIFLTATGFDLKNVNSARAIQEAMIQLMKQLSSYSIQFLSTITDSSVTVLDRPVIRVGDIDTDSSQDARYKLRVAVENVYGKTTSGKHWDIGHGVQIVDDRVHVSSNIQTRYDLTAGFTAASQVTTTRRLKLPLAKINLKRGLNINIGLEQRKLDGVWIVDVQEASVSLINKTIEKHDLDDYWPDVAEAAGLGVENMDEIFHDDSLSGFDLP